MLFINDFNYLKKILKRHLVIVLTGLNDNNEPNTVTLCCSIAASLRLSKFVQG